MIKLTEDAAKQIIASNTDGDPFDVPGCGVNGTVAAGI